MPGPAIDAQHVSRRFGRRWALIDVSFTVPVGSVMVVGGHNGSGKSTLFRVLSSVIRPDQGSATVSGFDVVREREDVRGAVAMLSHYSYLYESLTARENLRVAADHMRARHNEIDRVLDRVSLLWRADDFVSTFSAGMRKRLSLARVLLQDPKILLLDEPYGALDPEGFMLIDDVVGEAKSRGVTVLMATHQIEHVTRFADLALFLDQGRVATRS